MNFKNFVLKIVSVIIFDDIIKLEDFDLDNILLDKNQMKIFWFVTFHIKL